MYENTMLFFWLFYLIFIFCFQVFLSDDSDTVRIELSPYFANYLSFSYVIIPRMSVIFHVKYSHKETLYIFLIDAFSHVVS